MEILKAIILGVIQGLTEFLPVSSSGHLELGKAILDFQSEDDLLFTIIVHFATVLSTIVVFRKDILAIFKGLFQFKWNEDAQFAAKILISMVPIGLVGLFLKDQVEELFDGKILLVGCMLIVTGLLLYVTKFAEKKGKIGQPVSFTNAIVIGIAQAVAVLPGISRSGSTIAMGLLLGVDKSKIARFSFLMVIPPILGITLLDVKDFMETSSTTAIEPNYTPLIMGFLGAFFAGWLACTWMINIVKKGKLEYFAFYCFIVGAIAIATHFVG